MLSDPENTKHDPHASAVPPEVAVKVVERMRESAAVPTVLDAAAGRVNLMIVYVDGVSNTAAAGAGDGDGVVIGFGGFGGGGGAR